MTLPSAPQIGTTGVIQQPSIGEQLAPLFQALQQAQQAKAEQQQEARLARVQSMNAFIALSRVEPNLLDTETGKGMARDAGINPEQLVTRRQEELTRHQQALEATVKQIPPEAREAWAMVLRLGQIAPDLPAEIKTDLYKRMLPEGTEPQTFDRWLRLLSTGAVDSGQAATATGFELPPGFPAHARVPRALTAASDAEYARARKLTVELNSLNALMDDANRELEKEQQRINLRHGGAYYKQTGQFPPTAPGTPSAENRATIEFQRFQQTRYPQLSLWHQRRAELQQELDVVVGAPRTPPTTPGTPAPRRPRAPAAEVDPKAEQRAAWDAAATVLRQQRKDPIAVLGPRP